MFRVGNPVRFVGEISNSRLGGIIKKDGTVGKKGIWRLNNYDIYEVLKVHEPRRNFVFEIKTVEPFDYQLRKLM